jgi:beta-galactosidase
MNKKNYMSLLLVLILTWTAAAAREVLPFDMGWKFTLGDPQDAQVPGFDDSGWRDLDLPHDWSIEGPYDRNAPTGGSGGYLPTGVGWYRKIFLVAASVREGRVWIEFDGIYENSEVWINGHSLGKRPFGYISFQYDLTDHLVDGDNIIAVRVDNSNQPNSRWYSGSGIYRHVRLVIVDKLHVSHWGIYITTPEVSEDSATVAINTVIENSGSSQGRIMLRSVLLDPAGNEAAQIEDNELRTTANKIETEQTIPIKSPKLWSVERPVLYTLRTQVLQNGTPTDTVDTPFGIRKIEYDVDRGFLLNGRHVKMNGVCLHHDSGCLGAAVPERVWQRRLEILKAMGCNAIRTSHNPPAPEFLDLCDRMGFLVMDEAFDEWTIGKTKYGYHQYFEQWSERDLTDFIHRDRNHPSVVMWSVGNEVREQPREGGAEVLRKLADVVHREDKTRPFTQGCDNIAADGGSTTPEFLEMLDIVGYNYVDRWHERRELYYSIDRHDHPYWKMVGTESPSVGGIRGGYSLGRDPNVIRPNYNTRMIRVEQLWKFVAMHDYVIGDFMWTGIDYLGESRWPGKNSSSGVIDLCGFPKDGYYFYQSQWTTEPMIHLFPHWNWPGYEGKVIPVLCYTNCDAVELFLNGKSYGEKRLEFPRQGTSGGWNRYANPPINPTTADLHLSWDVPYEPGVLRAIGKKAGQVVCTQEVRTTGPEAAIRLKVDRDSISTARDVACVEVQIVDADGNIVPTADNLVSFAIEGSGRIIGVDNGNPQDHDSYQAQQRRAFNGLCLAVLQSSGEPGRIRFTAHSQGLKEASVEVTIK